MTFVFDRKLNFIDSNSAPLSAVTHWFAKGSIDDQFVKAHALVATPAVHTSGEGTLYRQDIVIRQTAYDAFDVDVPYGTRKNTNGEWTWGYDTTGGNLHISHGFEEVSRYPKDEAPDQKAAINVDGDKVEGADIIVPAMKVWVDFKRPAGIVTLQRAKDLSLITGRTNSDIFLTFAAGEVLYLGSRGSDGTVAAATERHEFAMSPNKTAQSIGDITGIALKGWEQVWAKWEDNSDTAGDGKTHAVRIAKFAYVVRVYEATGLSLGLGFGG